MFKSDDKENNPLDLAITLELGQKPLDLKNQEDQATISAAVKAVEMQKKFGQLNNMREDTSVFAKNTLLAAALFCDFTPQALTKGRGHEQETAISKNLRGSMAKVVKMGLDGLKTMFPGAPDDFYKDAQTLAGEKLKMLEARVDKLEARQDKLESRQDVVEKRVEDVPSRKSFEAHNEKLVAHAKELEELKENDKAQNEKLVVHAETLKEVKEKNKALNEKIDELEEKDKELNEKIEALVELVGEMRANIMKHFKFFREVSKSELEEKDKALNEKLEEMMQNITNDLDKRIAGVSKASIKRDNEIKLAIAATASAAAAKPGAAKEQEWIEQL